MRNLLIGAIAACCLGMAGAEESPEQDYSFVPKEAMPLYSDAPDSALSDTERRGWDIAREILEVMPQNGELPGLTAQDRAWAEELQRGAAGIADKALAADREKVLEFMGLSDDESRIYVFVSFSMPLELLRAYVREAIWSGAILVFRGIPEGMNLREFVTQKLYPLIGRKGASATIQIDPKLFDSFEVSSVPTIVYTEKAESDLCLTDRAQPFVSGGRALDYFACGPESPKDYWKLSGGVTIYWALEEFSSAGAPGARAHLESLNRGGFWNGQEQYPFDGDWDSVSLPDEENDLLETMKQYGDLYETPYGIGVGPAGMTDENQGIKLLRKPD